MKLANYTAKVNARNDSFAKKIRDLSSKYTIIGIVDVTGLQSLQLQRIRSSLKKTAKVLIVKKNLIEIVLNELEKSRPGISKLLGNNSGIIGLVFTNDNPFKLYKFVKKNKSSAFAKAGQQAPKEIVVPAGPTTFAPGPIIGELGALKIKAGITAGKVEIKADAVVAKEGDIITAQLAGILTRLGIEPMEVGLNIKAIYEGGTIYSRNVLDVDETVILNTLKAEANACFKLSVELGFYTKENVEYILSRAGRSALGLGVEVAYPAAETIKQLVSKANAQGTGVALTLPEGIRPAGVAAIAAPVVAGVPAANEASKKKTEEQPADVAGGFGGFF